LALVQPVPLEMSRPTALAHDARSRGSNRSGTSDLAYWLVSCVPMHQEPPVAVSTLEWDDLVVSALNLVEIADAAETRASRVESCVLPVVPLGSDASAMAVSSRWLSSS